MPKDFTLSPQADHDRMVPCLGGREVRRGETVSFPDEFVDGLRGQDDWIPSGWAWDPESAAEPPAPEPTPEAAEATTEEN